EDLAQGLPGAGVELAHLPAHRPGLLEVPAADLGLAVGGERDHRAIAAGDLVGSGGSDLVAPLEERGGGDETLGEHEVGGLGGADQLAHRLVVAAFLVLEDLAFALQSEALAERGAVDRVDLHAEGGDREMVFPDGGHLNSLRLKAQLKRSSVYQLSACLSRG